MDNLDNLWLKQYITKATRKKTKLIGQNISFGYWTFHLDIEHFYLSIQEKKIDMRTIYIFKDLYFLNYIVYQ